jgi:anti-sigma factor ChrR (cupin superfamily)
MMSEMKEWVLHSNKMDWEERYNPRQGKSSYRKLFITDPETGVYVHLRHYPAGFKTPWHRHPMAHGMFVLWGHLKTTYGVYGPGTFVYDPEGILAEHGGADDEDVWLLFFTNKKYDINYDDSENPVDNSGLKEIVIDTNKMDWEERYNPLLDRTSYRKLLLNDKETGVYFHLRHYPKGFRTPMHTHPCSHGMFVLAGKLQTSYGTYEPGDFVWCPEGVAEEHGAPDDEDCYCLFLTNKPFRVDYIKK